MQAIEIVQRLAPDPGSRKPLALVLGGFVLSRIIYAHAGIAFDARTFQDSWQVIDLRLLESQPVQSIWYLHTQPPLWNAFIALVMRLPVSLDTAFYFIYLALGVALCLLCFDLLRRFRVRPWVAAIVTLAIVASPTAMLYENWAFYEYPLAVLLLAFADATHRYISNGRLGPFVALLASASAIVLIRSLFHPIWLAVVLVVVLLARRPRFDPRLVVVGIAVPFLLIGVGMAKNNFMYQSPTLSSWMGFNLARSTTDTLTPAERTELIRSGEMSRLATNFAFQPYTSYRDVADPCTPTHPDEPVLSQPRTATGKDNFNYECYLPLFRQAQADGLTALKAHPNQFLRGQVMSYEIYLNDSANYVFVEENRRHIETFDQWYRHLVLWDVPVPVPDFEGNRVSRPTEIRVSLLLVLVTLANLAAGFVGAIRWRRFGAAAGRCTLVVVGITSAMVLLVGNALEVGENNRFRFMMEPLQFVVLAVWLNFAITQWWRRREGRVPMAAAASGRAGRRVPRLGRLRSPRPAGGASATVRRRPTHAPVAPGASSTPTTEPDRPGAEPTGDRTGPGKGETDEQDLVGARPGR